MRPLVPRETRILDLLADARNQFWDLIQDEEDFDASIRNFDDVIAEAQRQITARAELSLKPTSKPSAPQAQFADGKESCATCKGIGKVTVRGLTRNSIVTCGKCKGTGRLQTTIPAPLKEES